MTAVAYVYEPGALTSVTEAGLFVGVVLMLVIVVMVGVALLDEWWKGGA